MYWAKGYKNSSFFFILPIGTSLLCARMDAAAITNTFVHIWVIGLHGQADSWDGAP
jgi:hypothetical protein